MVFKQEMVERIGQNALTSLLFEVAATPKPGLVDRMNSGAHKDMDFFSFMSSTAALAPFFYQCAQRGAEFEGEDSTELFCTLRNPGMEAERSMFRATGGVNTQKGLIFSLGVISAAAAFCHRNDAVITDWNIDVICEIVSHMTKGLCLRELDCMSPNKKLTYGERLYREYGLKGIRGEVESGFATVRECSLRKYVEMKSEKAHTRNEILIQTLLHLIAVNDDINIVARHDLKTLAYVKGFASEVLYAGGIFTPTGRRKTLEMDRDFIRKNISPGGSADLLAVTVMFDLLQNQSNEDSYR